MTLLKCLQLHAKLQSDVMIFILYVHVFTKNSSRFVISIKNWIYRHVICIFLMKIMFLKKSWKVLHTKNFKKFVWTETSRFIYQSTQALTKITNLILFLLKNVIMKRKYCKMRALSHFQTKIISNSLPPSKTVLTDI